MPASRTRRSPNSRRPMLLAVLIAAAIALLGPAGAASAHTIVTGTSPKDGATVATVPQKVTLSFADTPIELGSEIHVEDQDGKNWADGPVQIVDTTVTQPIKAGAPAGKYTVTWRVVSPDSHPIEGTFTFTAKGPEAAGATEGAELGQAEPLQTPSSAASDETEVPNQPAVPWGMVGMIAVLVALVIIIAVVTRRKLARGDDDADEQ